ncbi:hypothetical protein Mapa_012515 [Marchantia paleacea]|nr:hypothetical protein Mapa_012515 [Marchantia paleacea]
MDADTCDRCTRSLTLTWYVPDHDLCYSCFAKENSSAPWYAYDTPVSEVRCNGCSMMVDGIKYTPATNLCHGCFSQTDDLEHAPYRLTNSGSFPLQPGSPVSSCRLEQSCSSSWSCDECKVQLMGTWYRPDYDLCYGCYKKRLPLGSRWYAYEGAQSSETQCDECKVIISGVKLTVSYDICQPCAQMKPYYAPLNCGYRPSNCHSCPDALGAVVIRFWPAPSSDHKLAGVPTPHLVLIATHYAQSARSSSFKIYNDVVEVGRDAALSFVTNSHSCLSLSKAWKGLHSSKDKKDKKILKKVEEELKVREVHFHDPDCQFPLMGGVQHAAKAFLATIDGQQLVKDLLSHR